MRLGFLVFIGLTALLVSPAYAADALEQHLTVKDHVFVPAELDVSAGQKLKLIIKNEDATPAEFESEELNREKLIPANGEIVVFIDPLDAGTYSFFDDFHPETTTGKIVAR